MGEVRGEEEVLILNPIRLLLEILHLLPLRLNIRLLFLLPTGSQLYKLKHQKTIGINQ